MRQGFPSAQCLSPPYGDECRSQVARPEALRVRTMLSFFALSVSSLHPSTSTFAPEGSSAGVKGTCMGSWHVMGCRLQQSG